jgi:hypothetical protein
MATQTKAWMTSFLYKEFLCRNPTLAKCEDETRTPKVRDLECSGTPKTSKLDFRGQNTSHWGVLDIIGKVLKRRCPKWPRMSHLDIWSPSYGQKKSRESNWQFDSRPLKVGNQPDPDVRWGSETWRWEALEESYKIGLNQNWFGREVMMAQSPGSPNQDSFGTPLWKSWDKEPFGRGRSGATQRILYGGRWWFPPSPGRGESSESKVTHGLSQHQKGAEWVLTNLWLVLDAGPNN